MRGPAEAREEGEVKARAAVKGKAWEVKGKAKARAKVAVAAAED